MTRFLLPLFAAFLLCLSPLRAQEGESRQAEKPKNIAFDFSVTANRDRATGKRATLAQISYARLLPGDQKIEFSSVSLGRGGLIEGETWTFLDAKGMPLGKLQNQFSPNGQLRSQLWSHGAQTETLDPQSANARRKFSLPGSILSARFELKNGFLSARFLRLELPDGVREIRTRYDAQGRPTQDSWSGKDEDKSKPITFFYDKNGLKRLGMSDENGPKDVELVYDREGVFRALEMRENGVLQSRLQTVFGPEMREDVQRWERYENGKLDSVLIMEGEKRVATQEEYDEGVLQSRKISRVGEGGAQILIREETFFVSGKASQITIYDNAGVVSKITSYRENGEVESEQNFENGARVPK